MSGEQNDEGRAGLLGPLVRASIDATPTDVPGRVRAIGGSIEAAAFWVAVILPLAYLPVVILDVWRGWQPVVLGALLFVHLCALALGHRYRR